METDTRIFDDIIRNELIHTCSSEDLSISNGRMGLTLFLFLYFRRTGKQLHEDIAGELLDDICGDLHTSLPIGFQNGLCGIGWGIEYLIQNLFIEESENILEDIDLKIMDRDIRRIKDFSLETGLEGIAWYFLLRANTSRNGNILDKNYQKDLFETCEKQKDQLSDALLSFITNRNTSKYPFKSILDRILPNEEETLSWKNGLKKLIL